MDHRVFGGVNLGINPIGLIFRVIILVIYFWGDVGGVMEIDFTSNRYPDAEHGRL
jgi:hypothetical protein